MRRVTFHGITSEVNETFARKVDDMFDAHLDREKKLFESQVEMYEEFINSGNPIFMAKGYEMINTSKASLEFHDHYANQKRDERYGIMNLRHADQETKDAIYERFDKGVP